MNWLLFILFMPLLFKMNWRDLVLRAVSDTAWVTFGAFIVERWLLAPYRPKRGTG